MGEPVWRKEPPEDDGWFWIYGHWTSPLMIVVHKYGDHFTDFNGKPICVNDTRGGVLWNHAPITRPENPR